MFKKCIFPEEHGQLVPGSPNRRDDNPYFDENSERQHIQVEGNVSTPALGQNMMRRLHRDPYEIYEPVKVLGTGSMGYVNMVKKRDDVIGGTARWHNLSTRKQLELTGFNPNVVAIATLPVLGDMFQKCTGIDEYIEERGILFKNLTERTERSNDCNASSHHGSISSQGYDSGGDSIYNPLEISSHPSSKLLPRHVRINSYINEQRSKGESEVYYALKSIHLSRVHDPVFVRELKNEIKLMKGFDHAHIVRPIETFEDKGHLYMVMELCSGGDLYSRDPYTEAQAARIVGSIVSAVAYMHEHHVIHRDLKYENIMFANTGENAEIKIIDFGLSKKFLPNQKLKEGVGTVYTMSPQVLKGDYTSKADVWAIGVLAYMLLSSQMPFYGRKRREILDKIMKCKYDFRGRRWTSVSPQAKQFISELLQYDRDQRPSAEEAKSIFWLNGGYTDSNRTTPATEDDLDVVRLSIENYASHTKLKKIALMVIAHKSTSEEIGFLRKVFKKYDHDMNGSIQLDEFKLVLSKYGFSDAYMENLFRGAVSIMDMFIYISFVSLFLFISSSRY